jgi:hypothetical protein
MAQNRSEAGRKGGQKTSSSREHMREIGRKGGEESRSAGSSSSGGQSLSAPGGSHAEHVRAGRQSHKNR